MYIPSRQYVRDRLPALGLAALLQLAAVWVFIHALVTPVIEHHDTERETQITLLPALPPPLVAKPKRPRRQPAGSSAINPYFNPYTYNPSGLAAPRPQGLAFALAACDVGNYDMAADEIRAACDRIGALIKRDPQHFGFSTEVTDLHHWQRELARREAPVLLPCLSPNGVDVLHTLTCIYEFIFTGYREDKRRRYSD